jgi:sigma-E factor negative regulatory protein RseC
MSLPQTIEHKGVVQNVRERGVTVRVMQSSACSSCAAARMCRSGESRERLIDVATKHASEFRVGEPVVLVATAQQSRMAVMLAYVLPLFLLLAALFVVRGLAGNDGLAALSALLVVSLYYGVLYCLRGRLSRNFRFDVSSDDGNRIIESNKTK